MNARLHDQLARFDPVHGDAWPGVSDTLGDLGMKRLAYAIAATVLVVFIVVNLIRGEGW